VRGFQHVENVLVSLLANQLDVNQIGGEHVNTHFLLLAYLGVCKRCYNCSEEGTFSDFCSQVWAVEPLCSSSVCL
jgi:hypothetical protein